MEKSLHSRYLNSQDQLIISLNDQIESMGPLKDSYATLQRYHIKLSHDFETLLAENDHISTAYVTKIQQLLAINQELDTKKNRYIDQLRNLQNQKAKLTLQRKNLMSSCDALSSKFNLENEQGIQLQQRTRQIIESIKRTEQNILTYRKIISQIECQIRLKSAQNHQIQNQILRRVQINRKATQKIESTQSEIKTVGIKNEKTLQQIRALDKTQDGLEIKIRQELKKSKQLSEKNLCKKQELANLNHQKQYYSRLIENQMIIKENNEISETKLNGSLERKIIECEKLAKQNSDLNNKIKSQQANLQKSSKYKQALTAHLSQLIKANLVLIDTMKRSCKQDEKAHLILNKKLQGLDIALIRSADVESVQNYKKSYALRERTNDLMNIKKAQKSGSTWINQLTDLENRC